MVWLDEVAWLQKNSEGNHSCTAEEVLHIQTVEESTKRDKRVRDQGQLKARKNEASFHKIV